MDASNCPAPQDKFLCIIWALPPLSAPNVFPFKASQLRTLLDSLVLQSRTWSLKAPAEEEDMHRTYQRYRAAAGVEEDTPRSDNDYRVYRAACVYRAAVKFVAGEVPSHLWWPDGTSDSISDEVKIIDDWLLRSPPGVVACRKYTLSHVAEGIRHFLDQEAPNASATDIPGVEAFASKGVHDLLRRIIPLADRGGLALLPGDIYHESGDYVQSFEAVARLWKVRRTGGSADGDSGDADVDHDGELEEKLRLFVAEDSGLGSVQPEDSKPELV
ncbi:hypothetical protein IMZ48_35400 [Candidatus Bathyarchaeota archaeon]|nr:hypothetical protein [Candidatus Bathyarchaeota archaeon]